MLAARLHDRKQLRVEQVPRPGAPGPGQILLRVGVTGLCGSDLHSYLDARIGDTPIEGPLILGHEFAGVVEAVGPNAVDGCFQPLRPGQRVAVDPAQPCHRCDQCEQGYPNLCRVLGFCGNYPHGGSLCQWMLMPAHCCFPVPASLDDVGAALLEPLGVALHAVDLARLRLAESVAIFGAGPIGLWILQLARLSGSDLVFVTDRLPWRLALAEQYGGIPIQCDSAEVRKRIHRETHGAGVDVALEVAWGGDSVGEVAEVVRPGGRVVLVGIPSDDRLTMKHSTARRKGLEILLSRRMRHAYPRALRLAERGRVDLHGLVSHTFRLDQAAEAFALNTAYRDKVVKVMVMCG